MLTYLLFATFVFLFILIFTFNIYQIEIDYYKELLEIEKETSHYYQKKYYQDKKDH